MALPDLFAVLSVVPHLRPMPLPDGGGMVLIGECEHFGLPVGDVTHVLQALDGTTDVDGVLAACANHVAPDRALAILGRLLDQGLLREVASEEQAAQAFASGLGLATRPEIQFVTVDAGRDMDRAIGARTAPNEVVAQALSQAGFQICSDAPTVLLLGSDYLQPSMRDTTRALLARSQRCFWLKPTGLRPLLGPLFSGASQQACPTCLCQHLLEQRPVEALLQPHSRTWQTLAPSADLAASVHAVANMAALELRRLLSLQDALTSPIRLFSVDFSRFALQAHPVRRRPQCPDCGDPDEMRRRGESPIRLVSAPIAYAEDGGLRIESPTQSYARCADLVSEVLGPATHLEPMPGVDGHLPLVYSSGYRVRPSRLGPGEAFYRRCAGKGSTPEQARMSALAECIERYSGVYRGDEAYRFASAAELGDAALHPDQLHLFSDAQRAHDEAVPPPLPTDERIAWTPAWSLLSGVRRYMPLASCYSEVPVEMGAGYCRPSSNGSAAGNCLEEAILQGLFEAVERDAVAIWWYCRLRRPAALVSDGAEAAFSIEREVLARRGWSLWALDLTHDLGIPVVVAVGVHSADERLALGFGCHTQPALALRRAVSELHQVVLPQRPVRTPWDGMVASQLPYLFPDSAAPRQIPDPPHPGGDLRDHVLDLAQRLDRCGLELLAVDKSRADLPLRVAQVVVPGLRHAWPRFGPGRLYSVPVALGWLPAPLHEAELNPLPLLI
ncbi:MAG: TOMM precursor leader peptide-binding protein [Myxococcales bacterium]|nr:TOMM precursor leader peptide-binding protein [Myxococcales bacterium]